MIPSENTITFNTSEGKIHPIVVFSNQTPISANTVYIINYDRNALEIDDLCAFTFAKETTRGMIAGTSLEVISVSPGEIQFKINSPENKIITGVLDCIIFKGLTVTSTTVSIIVNNKENQHENKTNYQFNIGDLYSLSEHSYCLR